MALKFPDRCPEDLTDLEAQVRRTIGTLRCDFANGGIGERHNTYQHRTRVIRQLTARRDHALATAEGGALA